MTTAELDALEPGTLLYLPTDWDVTKWLLQGRVGTSNYYTVMHPPDNDGVVSNRRPVYLHSLDLLNATLNATEAWQRVGDGLQERIEWIERNKLNGR